MAQPSDSKATEPEAKTAKASESATGSPAAVEMTDKEISADLAAPYGTRSRNRNGSSRPNYAEDRDFDAEMYDADHGKAHGDSKKSARQANAATNGDGARAVSSARKAPGDESKQPSSLNGSKEHTPSATTAASNSVQTTGSNTVQPSRKRKAATAAQQANSNSAVSSTRRSGVGAQMSPATSWPETNMLTFSNARARPQNGRLVADDGTVLEPNDHVYLVCEPAGEPYYLGRIMEFLHPQNDTSKPVDAVRINWFYRPRDIGRKVSDTRVVFATMHSDISPLTALRGKCQIRHRSDVGNEKQMDEYRRVPDNFWFEKLYDRYIQKNYDLIPTRNIVNVPGKVKKVLDDRWDFVLVEQGRGKELTSAVKSCKRCSGYCASNDSVDCAVCQNTFHMNCVRPPLLKKPSRGFAWSCAACSRAQERKLEARHTATHTHDGDEDEPLEEDEDEALGADTVRSSPEEPEEAHHHGTAEQIHNASLWPWRYLGMHCKPEDALDYDDRIYPRASTRIGPRHQAAVLPWPGRPVHYVKPPEKKKGKNAKAAAEEAQAAELYPDGKRPKWVQDTPPGYIARGGDTIDPDDPEATATLIYKPPTSEETVKKVDSFMTEVRGMGKSLGLPERSTNLQDVALEILYRKNYDGEKAMAALKATDKKYFKEPSLTAAEQKRWDEAIAKHGSELNGVKKAVKTMTPGMVTRYYYTWKKTERGHAIWSNYSGRKGKKEAKRAEAAATKIADDVADDEDDSAFDSGKAAEKKRAFMCQFCSTTTSRRWRRAPNPTTGLVNEDGVKATGKDKGNQYIVALCTRCAELWRRYAIRWEDIDEVAKKLNAGKAWKRKQDEELLKELQLADDIGLLTPDRAATPQPSQEPPRKKLKGAPEKEESDGGSGSGISISIKKKEKISEPPAVPEMPKPRTLPCAVCDQLEPMTDHVSCRECRLSVHRGCYGIVEHRVTGKWTCDMCINDKNPQVSTNYKCVLCPVEHTEQELIDQPKLTHHKKKMSDKDREREKLEVQQARKALELYRKKQEDANRPLMPREPLKRTADNNWVHVICSTFIPEVKFGNAKALEPSEGIPSIPRTRYEEVCNACNNTGGACVTCLTCRAPFHAECARKQGHVLGFDVIPVKSTRRDQNLLVTFKGESGIMAPGLWCPDVPIKTAMHPIHEINDEGLNALQFYVQNYKQADLALTGTVRKANLMTTAAKMSGTALQAGLRRMSTTASLTNGGPVQLRNGDVPDGHSNKTLQSGDKICVSCGIDVSPRWWSIDNNGGQGPNPFYSVVGKMGEEARKFISQRAYQCHKCHAAKIPMKPPSPKVRPHWSSHENSRMINGPEPGIAAAVSASTSAMRSPEPHSIPNHRDPRQAHQPWSQPPSIHAVVQPLQAPPGQPHPNGPRHGYSPASTHSVATGPSTVPPPIQAPSLYGNDWIGRPGSQHGSPPRHLNGGPPTLTNGPPGGLSGLRPPNIGGPLPGPPPMGHQPPHGHAHQPYMNGMPPSPRRAPGPVPPPAYAPPHHPPSIHGLPPSHGSPYAAHRGLSNGVAPPPPPPPPQRHDPYSQGHPRAPMMGSHGSPLGSRAGLPPPHESPVLSQASHSRNSSDTRPTSGASANPSLRNLLS